MMDDKEQLATVNKKRIVNKRNDIYREATYSRILSNAAKLLDHIYSSTSGCIGPSRGSLISASLGSPSRGNLSEPSLNVKLNLVVRIQRLINIKIRPCKLPAHISRLRLRSQYVQLLPSLVKEFVNTATYYYLSKLIRNETDLSLQIYRLLDKIQDIPFISGYHAVILCFMYD